MNLQEPINGAFFEPVPGVYKITNTISGRVYIGQSVSVQSRLSTHFYDLFRNKHPNGLMQRDWNKYGSNSFCVEIVDRVSGSKKRLVCESIEQERCIDRGINLYNEYMTPSENIINGRPVNSRKNRLKKRKKVRAENVKNSKFARDRMGRFELR